jgi:hypothetical protein
LECGIGNNIRLSRWNTQGSSWVEILGRSDFLAKNREKGNNQYALTCMAIHPLTII